MSWLDKIGGFLRSQLSESDGTVSNTRVCILLVICSASGWVTALVSKVKGPVNLPELGGFVGSLGMYVSGICASLYAINKGAEAWKNRADRPQDEGQPPQQ